MSEIKLNKRYPESRLEDVTDAYMRGFEVGLAMRADESAELRELVRDMADAIVDWYDLMDGAFACESVYEDEKFAPLFDRMRELGVEV